MKEFNTDINIIGSIPDYNLIFKSFNLHSNNDFTKIRECILDKNEFNIRTEKSRKLFVRVLETSVLIFKNSFHEDLLKSIYNKEGIIRTKEVFLFLQFATNNALFFNISKNVFLKLFFNNRYILPRDDIIAYMKELFKELNYDYLTWSDATIKIVASKYLTFLKKIDFVEGKVKKQIKHFQFDNLTFVLFIYFLKALYPDIPNMLNNPMIEFCFHSKEIFYERVKNLAMKEYYNMSFTGNVLEIEILHKYKDIINVILNRKSNEI